MLNEKTGDRELAYIVKIDDIVSIQGSDNCECIVVGGWNVMVRKGEFQKNDLAVYFEIDSKVPETDVFAFLARKHYAIKSQRYTFGGKGNFISQGLVMPLSDFGWTFDSENKVYDSNEKVVHRLGDYLTKELGVTYYEPSDNKKGNTVSEYETKGQRRFKKTKFFKFLMKYEWSRNLLLRLMKPKTIAYPSWIKKTDSERIQNKLNILKDKKTKYYVSEKIDGTSTTFTVYKDKGRLKFLICSRNRVVFDGVYKEMADKYDMHAKMRKMFKDLGVKRTLVIQGETYGAKVQKNTYGLNERNFKAFNLYVDGTYIDLARAEIILSKYEIPIVPIINYAYTLPNTIEQLMEYATGASQINGDWREGLVFKNASGAINFKCVSNTYLLKWNK